jgi:hypothetical protein
MKQIAKILSHLFLAELTSKTKLFKKLEYASKNSFSSSTKLSIM